MTRKITALCLSLVLLISSFSASAAARASDYLSSYTLGLLAKGDGLMSISYTVCGVEIMDKVGAVEIIVEEKIGSYWFEYQVFDGEEDGLYSTGTISKSGNLYFYGIPGTTYRATIIPYAELDGGSDTGDLTCTPEVCI